MGAGFERDVERRTASKFPSLAQRDYLRVVLSGGLSVAFPDDPAVSSRRPPQPAGSGLCSRPPRAPTPAHAA